MLETVMKNLTSAVTELTAALHIVRLPSTNGATAITPTPAQDAQETPSPAPVAAPEPAPTTAQPGAAAGPPPVPTEPPVKAPTKKQLVEKFIELAQTKDREVAIKLLADFGVGNLPELKDKSKWADFITAVDTLLAG